MKNSKECHEGYHWVKSYRKRNGETVKGHCAANPYGSTQRFLDLMNSAKKQKIGPYGRRKY